MDGISKDIEAYVSVPIGSLIRRTREEEARYFAEYDTLPEELKQLIKSPKTGAFVRGLLRNYQITVPAAATLAFRILQICFGEKSLMQLPSMLSMDLKLANDKAQKMAAEIERDLLAPVALELNQFLNQKRNQAVLRAGQQAKEAGATNVLNLKVQTRPLPPPGFPLSRE